MEHTIRNEEGVTVISIGGPIDVSKALELRNLLGEQVAAAGQKVLLEMSGVPLIDSSGIGVMVSAHRRAEQAGAAFALAEPSEAVAKVFALTRTDRLLSIYPSVAEGVAALSA